ncbi:MAG: hypothetical protein WA840_20900, partial [Caulobacteraceae bacterium]
MDEDMARRARGYPSAFQGDVRTYRALATAKAAWWSANRALGHAVTRRDDPPAAPAFSAEPPP